MLQYLSSYFAWFVMKQKSNLPLSMNIDRMQSSTSSPVCISRQWYLETGLPGQNSLALAFQYNQFGHIPVFANLIPEDLAFRPLLNWSNYKIYIQRMKNWFERSKARQNGERTKEYSRTRQIIKVKSRVKTWQVRRIWSQQLAHKQVQKRGDGTRCPEG